MKIFGGHKGFAFVEYVTKQETQNALQALSSTHLYGRRLVSPKKIALNKFVKLFILHVEVKMVSLKSLGSREG